MSEETIEEEVMLSFKRFPAEKQDQVRALVNYSILMGLDGKDLVSIGGKLERIKKRQATERWRSIAEDLIKNTKDHSEDIRRGVNRPRRWDYIDATGQRWRFDCADYWSVRITNTATNRRKSFTNLQSFDVGRSGDYNRMNIMLNLHEGIIDLNF